jgi:hypothetical protein
LIEEEEEEEEEEEKGGLGKKQESWGKKDAYPREYKVFKYISPGHDLNSGAVLDLFGWKGGGEGFIQPKTYGLDGFCYYQIRELRCIDE